MENCNNNNNIFLSGRFQHESKASIPKENDFRDQYRELSDEELFKQFGISSYLLECVEKITKTINFKSLVSKPHFYGCNYTAFIIHLSNIENAFRSRVCPEEFESYQEKSSEGLEDWKKKPCKEFEDYEEKKRALVPIPEKERSDEKTVMDLIEFITDLWGNFFADIVENPNQTEQEYYEKYFSAFGEKELLILWQHYENKCYDAGKKFFDNVHKFSECEREYQSIIGLYKRLSGPFARSRGSLTYLAEKLATSYERLHFPYKKEKELQFLQNKAENCFSPHFYNGHSSKESYALTFDHTFDGAYLGLSEALENLAKDRKECYRILVERMVTVKLV